ncbi:MAG TPA: hypothetical protein VE869_03780 [Gemmatimonas sp.]|nr:hypothetical protein [Gemmatimonas sp.]
MPPDNAMTTRADRTHDRSHASSVSRGSPSAREAAPSDVTYAHVQPRGALQLVATNEDERFSNGAALLRSRYDAATVLRRSLLDARMALVHKHLLLIQERYALLLAARAQVKMSRFAGPATVLTRGGSHEV